MQRSRAESRPIAAASPGCVVDSSKQLSNQQASARSLRPSLATHSSPRTVSRRTPSLTASFSFCPVDGSNLNPFQAVHNSRSGSRNATPRSIYRATAAGLRRGDRSRRSRVATKIIYNPRVNSPSLARDRFHKNGALRTRPRYLLRRRRRIELSRAYVDRYVSIHAIPRETRSTATGRECDD